MTIAVDMGRKATKTNKKPTRRVGGYIVSGADLVGGDVSVHFHFHALSSEPVDGF